MKKKNFVKAAINKQFKIAGHDYTYKLAVAEPKYEGDDFMAKQWLNRFTITFEQEREFMNWFIPKVMKVFKVNKVMAERQWSWFNLSYGLRREDYSKGINIYEG